LDVHAIGLEMLCMFWTPWMTLCFRNYSLLPHSTQRMPPYVVHLSKQFLTLASSTTNTWEVPRRTMRGGARGKGVGVCMVNPLMQPTLRHSYQAFPGLIVVGSVLGAKGCIRTAWELRNAPIPIPRGASQMHRATSVRKWRGTCHA